MVPRGELVCTYRYGCYTSVHQVRLYIWIELSITKSTGEILLWFAHKWSKEFLISQDVSSQIEIYFLQISTEYPYYLN